MTSSTYVLVIPYEMKDTAKENKCQWNKEEKYWYMKSHDDDPVLMKFVEDYSRVDLPLTTYGDREELKANGAKWDADEKKWYTYKSNENLQKFMCLFDRKQKTKTKVKQTQHKNKHNKQKQTKTQTQKTNKKQTQT